MSCFSSQLLTLDAEAECARIVETLREQLGRGLRRRGLVLGLSGGVDSSVTAALCVRAVGASRVLGILMPEHDSAPESERLGLLAGEHLGVAVVREDIGPILDAAGCYRRRDEAIRSVEPRYAPGDKCKIVLPDLDAAGAFRLFSVVIQFRAGGTANVRLPFDAYQTIVAATNFKQRVRKMIEYFHADRLHYAVAGTPNRLEYDQGFFVKNGDGSADVKPIAHLYKTQVYQLARQLGVPEEIVSRPPTTDTYPLEQSQEEFFFSVPLAILDQCLYAHDHGVPPEVVAPAVNLPVARIAAVYQDINAKRRSAEYLHAPPLLIPPTNSRSGAP